MILQTVFGFSFCFENLCWNTRLGHRGLGHCGLGHCVLTQLGFYQKPCLTTPTHIHFDTEHCYLPPSLFPETVSGLLRMGQIIIFVSSHLPLFSRG
jgi:hypothetical protein